MIYHYWQQHHTLIRGSIYTGGFPCSSAGKESSCNAGATGSIPGSGRSPREGIGYPFQYSWAFLVAQMVICLQCRRPWFNSWVGKIPWRREGLPTPVFWPGEFQSWTRLSGFHFHFQGLPCWLRLHPCNAEDRGLMPDQGTQSHTSQVTPSTDE